jgi:hypothetical protein
MRGVGVPVNCQIGRCYNREGFKNQQNLQRAMAEAKRLVEQGPIPRSRSLSPIEYEDHSKVLLNLLKSITSEIDELSPQNSLTVGQAVKAKSNTSLTTMTSQMKPSTDKAPIPQQKKTVAASGKKAAAPQMASSPPPEIEITAADHKTHKNVLTVHVKEEAKVTKTPTASIPSQKSTVPPPPPQTVPKTEKINKQILAASSTEHLTKSMNEDTLGSTPPALMPKRKDVSPVRRQQPKTGWL